MDYQDANTTNSSYSYLKNLIISRANKDAITLKETNDDTYSNSLVDGFDVVHVLAPTFYVTAYSNCVDKVVFLIEGNLVITPDLKITGANREAACMFIVQGKTTIRDDNDEDSGINDDDGDGIPDPDTDIVRAFIVTNQFETELNNQDDSLEILGGLIINSTNTGGSIFNRNVNNNASRIIYPSKPSELFVYEGARYIDNLRHILFSPLTASIVEPQYMLTVN
jgi:hypothetical protein